MAAYIKSSKGVKGWIDVNTGYSQDEENGLVKDSFYWGWYPDMSKKASEVAN